MSNIIDSIRLSGTTYQIQGGSITVDTELNSGSTNPVQNKVIYNKIDEVEEVTAAGLNALNDELGGKQDTLVSGTNIKTINNESILGSGNIDIQGGSTYTAGRGISIANDTISFNLPISAGTGTNSIIEGSTTSRASGAYSHAEGSNTRANGEESHAEGYSTTANTAYSHAEGNSTNASGASSHAEGTRTIANNASEHASGQYNVSYKSNTTFGNSGNTLFSVGNGTSNSARHNAFEIRQNGDIYLTKDGQDVKLQDQLGGGSITVDTALDSGSTNPVQNKVIYNKIDEVEEVTAAGLNALNDKINPTVELTQAEYDALTEKDPNTYYIITDAQAGDLTNYYTKSETNTLLGGKADTATTYTKTEVDTALSSKANTATTYTKTEVDNAITAATATKQDTLVSGTNIKTINNESILGSGNIDIQSGGKAIEAGRGISITTGETADTVSFNLPISAGTGTNSIKCGETSQASGNDSFAIGANGVKASGQASFAGGSYSEAKGFSSMAFGRYNIANNYGEVALGFFNKSNGSSSAAGNSSGNTLFSVGNGTNYTSSTRHNAFEIRQNGDIYCSDGTNDVKLQDTITATTANTTALGGLSLVKLTQAEYDALSPNYDSNTLYVIT